MKYYRKEVMMPTPKPEPTVMTLLKGNPAKKSLDKLKDDVNPTIPPKAPKSPHFLSGYAKEEWIEISVKLHRLGLLTEVDINALAIYCQAYARWREAEEELALESLTLESTNGNVIKNPLVSIANEAMRDLSRYLSDFGMNPSARTKVKAAEKPKHGKFTGLINGGKK